MPPLAQTNPWWVSVIEHAVRHPDDATASRRTTSIWRGRGRRSSRTRPPPAAARRSSRSTIAPSAFETTFWVTTRTSCSRSGSAPSGAFDRVADERGEIVAGSISGTPSSATTSSRPVGGAASAGIDRLGAASSGSSASDSTQQEVVGRVEVEAERPVELDVAGAGRVRAGLVGMPALATEPTARSRPAGRGPDRSCRAVAGPGRGRRAGDRRRRRLARGAARGRVRRDQREVDRQDDDRVGAAGHRIGSRVFEARVQARPRWSSVRAPRKAAWSRAARSGVTTRTSRCRECRGPPESSGTPSCRRGRVVPPRRACRRGATWRPRGCRSE